MYEYKNTSDHEQVLVGFGEVAAGDTIIVDSAVENPNFEFIGEVKKAGAVEGQIVDRPTPVEAPAEAEVLSAPATAGQLPAQSNDGVTA